MRPNANQSSKLTFEFSYYLDLEKNSNKKSALTDIQFSLVPKLQEKIREELNKFLAKLQLSKKSDDFSVFPVFKIASNADHLFEIVKNTYDKLILQANGNKVMEICFVFNVSLMDDNIRISLKDTGGGFGQLKEVKRIKYLDYHNANSQSEKHDQAATTGGANRGLRQLNASLNKVGGGLDVATSLDKNGEHCAELIFMGPLVAVNEKTERTTQQTTMQCLNVSPNVSFVSNSLGGIRGKPVSNDNSRSLSIFERRKLRKLNVNVEESSVKTAFPNNMQNRIFYLPTGQVDKLEENKQNDIAGKKKRKRNNSVNDDETLDSKNSTSPS